MISTISVGGKDYPLTPMGVYEATEVMFVLSPYVIPLSLREEPLDRLEDLFAAMQETNPSDLFRLLAYMLHTDMDNLLTDEVLGKELVDALIMCFSVNSLPDLVNMAFALRIVETGWHYGS